MSIILYSVPHGSGYLDDEEELRVDTVQRLRLYTSALLTGSISPIEVAEDWGNWFDLAPAFVLVSGTTELQEMQDEAMFLYRPDAGDGPALSGRDRTYLAASEPLLVPRDADGRRGVDLSLIGRIGHPTRWPEPANTGSASRRHQATISRLLGAST